MARTRSSVRFGDRVRNVKASPDNPRRDGIFVCIITRAGKLNPGRVARITDGEGYFWTTPEENLILLPDDRPERKGA